MQRLQHAATRVPIAVDHAAIALGLFAVTLLGAAACPSPAWAVPAVVVGALALAPARTTDEPLLWMRLLHAALGATIGLGYLLLVLTV